jgi:hypothetical protein
MTIAIRRSSYSSLHSISYAILYISCGYRQCEPQYHVGSHFPANSLSILEGL